MDFSLKLKELCKEIDKVVYSKPSTITYKLYNIHKRSLPVSSDKIVLQNLDGEGVKFWLKKLKTHIKNDIVYYYDVVSCDASGLEKSVYYNPKEVVTNA